MRNKMLSGSEVKPRNGHSTLLRRFYFSSSHNKVISLNCFGNYNWDLQIKIRSERFVIEIKVKHDELFTSVALKFFITDVSNYFVSFFRFLALPLRWRSCTNQRRFSLTGNS